MSGGDRRIIEPSALLIDFASLLDDVPGPVLDLACGECRNGLYLAQRGIETVCLDRSEEGLAEASRLAESLGLRIVTRQVDLEIPGASPLPENGYGAILVFRYLHRPLFPHIKRAIRPGGILIYETFTTMQVKLGKPSNPAFLLRQGELAEWFSDWETLYRFEGEKENPRRAVAQLVSRKPLR